MGRYIFLRESIKAKRERKKIIVNELISLWEKKLKFPYLSNQGACQKFDQILKTYLECIRRGKYEFWKSLYSSPDQKEFFVIHL